MVRRLMFIAALGFIGGTALGCGDDDREGRVDTAPEPRDATDADPETQSDTTIATSDDATDATASDGMPDAPGEEVAEDVAAEVADIDDSPLGGERPAKLVLPPGYRPGTPTPLVILLHGYSVGGEIQDFYLKLSPNAAAKGFITLVPDGTKNATGTPFWNASPGWCCDFAGSGVDDAGYLLGLVAEAKTRFTIDPARVFLVGHSNGGFMSYKMACEHADVFAAIVSIAGSMPLDAADCAPSEPVSVLQVHGTADATILFGGVFGQYPSADEVVKRWAGHDGCELLPASEPVANYDGTVLGDETHPHPFPGCSDGSAVALWELQGSGHIPTFTDTFMPTVLEWLLAHPKQ